MSFNWNTMTLMDFVLAEHRELAPPEGELIRLLTGIQEAVQLISSAVRKAGHTDMYGISGNTNVQGEEVKKLDDLSNEIFINKFKSSHTTCLLVSEENESIIEIPAEEQGRYVVCFDPLDGSSNIDCLASIGSIFAIYEKLDASKKPSLADALQPGRRIVAAGYALYGSATMIVLSLGKGVHGFVYDTDRQGFYLTDRNMRVPARGNIYSVNEGYEGSWDPTIKAYVQSKKYPVSGKAYGARYVGSMVADVHRTIKYGGIFMYPASKSSPNGKLRLLYECNPMAYLLEHAGGAASTGQIRILDVVPTTIHQRTPIFLGSIEDVADVLSYIRNKK